MGNLMLSSTFSAIIDVFALALLIFFSLSGLKHGFVKTFVKVFGTIISLLLAVIFCSKCAIFLENQFGLITSIGVKVSGVVTNIFGETIANTTLSQAIESELSELGLSGWLIKIVMEAKTDSTIPMDITLNQIISPALSYYIACGISVLILYVIFKILLFILGDITSKLSALNPLGLANKALGFILGIVRGVVIIQVAIIVINIIPLGFMQTLSLQITNSSVVGFIQKINIFDIIIKSFSKLDILSYIKTTV